MCVHSMQVLVAVVVLVWVGVGVSVGVGVGAGVRMRHSMCVGVGVSVGVGLCVRMGVLRASACAHPCACAPAVEQFRSPYTAGIHTTTSRRTSLMQDFPPVVLL